MLVVNGFQSKAMRLTGTGLTWSEADVLGCRPPNTKSLHACACRPQKNQDAKTQDVRDLDSGIDHVRRRSCVL